MEMLCVVVVCVGTSVLCLCVWQQQIIVVDDDIPPRMRMMMTFSFFRAIYLPPETAKKAPQRCFSIMSSVEPFLTVVNC